MKCKLDKLEIPANQPFKNCKLDREKYAEILKTIITTYQKGFVLAINGKWGTGKTTFVEMWKAYLELDGFHTLYFNAWENDFISDPLVGLLGELKKMNSQEKAEAALTSVINTAGKIVLKAAPAMFKGVVKRYAGEEIVDILCDGIEEGASMLKKEIENYESQKYSLKQFRDELETYVDEVCDKKPLIFIIDELDRCNPHYAVKTLERIKHLFNIPNIVFVLSIDKEQLSNSIRGYYGSDLIEADEYLKRFIDIEYILPAPNIGQFCNYLYDYYGFDSYEKARDSRDGLKDSFLVIANILFMYKSLSLRQIEKIFTHIRLSLNMYNYNQIIYSDLVCLLTYLRICESDCYDKINYKSYSIQELIDQIETIIPKQIFNVESNASHSPNRYFYFTLALLLRCYVYSYQNSDNNDKLLTRTLVPQSKLEINFNVKIINKELLAETLEWAYERNKIIPLSYFTNKIDLLENFMIVNTVE
jgi:hypothetical protein